MKKQAYNDMHSLLSDTSNRCLTHLSVSTIIAITTVISSILCFISGTINGALISECCRKRKVLTMATELVTNSPNLSPQGQVDSEHNIEQAQYENILELNLQDRNSDSDVERQVELKENIAYESHRMKFE